MIGIFYGTRPEYIKIAPLVKELKDKGVEHTLFQVQQHGTLLEGCDYDFIIPIFESGSRLNSITISILLYPLPQDLDHVLVQGDTTTAMAVALNAFNNQIPVIHLEAGMRTYDNMNPYPEETNRRIISSVASIHLCASEREKDNLEKEGHHGIIEVTGNPSIDNLVGIKTSYGNKVVVTMHRRENHNSLEEWFKSIDGIAASSDYEFILPLHPNPNVQRYKDLFEHVKVVDPIPHSEMLDLLANSIAVISDSGGVSEECSYLNKICLVCRSVTERGQSAYEIVCATPDALVKTWKGLKLENGSYLSREGSTCPYGDGNAAEKIATILKNVIFS